MKEKIRHTCQKEEEERKKRPQGGEIDNVQAVHVARVKVRAIVYICVYMMLRRPEVNALVNVCSA